MICHGLSADRKCATRWHRISGIRREIQEQLFQVPLSRLDIGKHIGKLNVQPDTLSFKAISEDRERAVQGATYIALNVGLAGISRQSQHSAEDSAAGLYGLLDLLNIVGEGIPVQPVRLDVRQDLLHQRQDASESVIHIV
jgi:hypothetical protein